MQKKTEEYTLETISRGKFLAENTRDRARARACLIGAQLITQFVVSTWHAAAFVLVSFVVLVGTHKFRSCFAGVGLSGLMNWQVEVNGWKSEHLLKMVNVLVKEFIEI